MFTAVPRFRSTTSWMVVAPLPALALGILVMMRAEVPRAAGIQNLAAAAVGALLVFATPAHASAPVPSVATRWLIAAGVALLGATLTQPGVEGVHRWLAIGPVQLHAAAVVLPALLVLISQLDRFPSLLAALVVLCVLVLQPDAAQAAAFAAGWSVLAMMERGRRETGTVALVLLLSAAAALRPDPLQPVAHVEGIVGLAVREGWRWGAASLATLALPPIVILIAPARRAGAPLAAYLSGTLLASWLGNFPVPFLGYGVAPILGYYLAVAALRSQPVDVTGRVRT